MKISQIDKAIEKLEAEKRVLDLAIAKLREQQSTPRERKPRKAKPEAVAKSA